jgi:hypothetical protein
MLYLWNRTGNIRSKLYKDTLVHVCQLTMKTATTINKASKLRIIAVDYFAAIFHFKKRTGVWMQCRLSRYGRRCSAADYSRLLRDGANYFGQPAESNSRFI